MIYNTLIWTKRGWLRADELIIGDVTISYDSQRNCTEYDKISHIQTEYGINAILGLKSHSLNLSVTPDHPFILRNTKYKFIERKAISDVFLKSFNEERTVLYAAPFEPYLLSKDLDDVAWSARVASSFSNSRYMPISHIKDIWDIVEDLCAYEAQHWVDIFFHWNVLLAGSYWSKAVKLENKQVKDLVHHIAPRAGFGSKLTRNPKIAGNKWIIGLATQNAPQIRNINWYRDRIEGLTFNVKTKNGNFLAKKSYGTFLCPCDIT